MALYNIYAGMSGSFGGAEYQCTEEFPSLEIAERYAYDAACDEYESYAGLHGIRSIEEIAEEYCEENGVTEEELSDFDQENIFEIFCEEREGWLVYHAILASEDPDKDRYDG